MRAIAQKFLQKEVICDLNAREKKNTYINI